MRFILNESLKPKPEPEPMANVNNEALNNTNLPTANNNDVTFSFKPGSKVEKLMVKIQMFEENQTQMCNTKKGDRIGTCMKKTVVKPGLRLKEFETFKLKPLGLYQFSNGIFPTGSSWDLHLRLHHKYLCLHHQLRNTFVSFYL